MTHPGPGPRHPGRRTAPIPFAAALLLAALLLAALPAVVAAESPSPSAVTGGDTRSAGEGPGFVGSPGMAIGAVAAIGVVTLLGTLAYIRLTGGPGRGSR